MGHGPPWPAMAWRLAPGPSATRRRMGGAPRYPARGPSRASLLRPAPAAPVAPQGPADLRAPVAPQAP
eukprot:9388261-Alexandrium_andersonii.AAC.1